MLVNVGRSAVARQLQHSCARRSVVIGASSRLLDLTANQATTHNIQPINNNKVHSFSSAAVKEEPSSPTSSTKAEVSFTPTDSRKYQFFQNVEVTPSGVAIIRFDNPDKKVNTLSFALMHEAKAMWENEIHTNNNIKSVVFTSAKESGFIAGADIFDISSIEDKSTLVPIIEEALQFFLHMKAKNVP